MLVRLAIVCKYIPLTCLGGKLTAKKTTRALAMMAILSVTFSHPRCVALLMQTPSLLSLCCGALSS